MSPVEAKQRLRVLWTRLVSEGGLLIFEGVPFTGVSITIEPDRRCRFGWVEHGRLRGPYVEEMLGMDQDIVLWDQADDLDYNDLYKVVYQERHLDGSVLSPIQRNSDDVWSMMEMRDGSATGNGLCWHSDGRLAEYSQVTELDDGVRLQQRFTWGVGGDLESSFVRASQLLQRSETTQSVALDRSGRLSRLSWTRPEAILDVVPNLQELVADRVFLNYAEIAELDVSDELSLNGPDALEESLLDVLLANDRLGELRKLNTTATADGLERLLAAAPALESVDYFASRPSPEVVGILEAWRTAAPGRSIKHR